MIFGRKIAVSVVASLFVLPAHAFEKLLGEYEGKVTKVEGSYRGKEGDACTAKVAKVDHYGEAIKFTINSENAINFSTTKVNDALAAKTDSLVTLHVGRKRIGSEDVTMKLRGDGSVEFLELRHAVFQIPGGNSIACRDLAKK